MRKNYVYEHNIALKIISTLELKKHNSIYSKRKCKHLVEQIYISKFYSKILLSNISKGEPNNNITRAFYRWSIHCAVQCTSMSTLLTYFCYRVQCKSMESCTFNISYETMRRSTHFLLINYGYWKNAIENVYRSTRLTRVIDNSPLQLTWAPRMALALNSRYPPQGSDTNTNYKNHHVFTFASICTAIRLWIREHILQFITQLQWCTNNSNSFEQTCYDQYDFNNSEQINIDIDST